MKSIPEQIVEKRYERRQYKAKFNEKAEFMPINEYFEANFNAVVTSDVVFQQPADSRSQAVPEKKDHSRKAGIVSF